MIISPCHKFIFLKPRMVAGTSVEVTLAQHCGEDDIVTPIGAFYFDRSGPVGLDFLIRNEDLQEDYSSVCERIGLWVPF